MVAAASLLASGVMAGDSLWVVNSSNIYPKLLANVTDQLADGEVIDKILPLSGDPGTLLVLTKTTKGEGEAQTTVGRVKTLSLYNGTLTNVSVGLLDTTQMTIAEENILDVAVYYNYVWVLTQNGTVWWKNFSYASNSFQKYDKLEGITQIAMCKPYGYGYLYMLTTKGTVCSVSAGSVHNSWDSVPLDEGVKITQLGLADGFLMMDESGRYYPMTTEGNVRNAVNYLYSTYDFNKIREQVVDVALHQASSGNTPQFMFLLNDGSLVSLGNAYNNSPLYSSYSGYTWTQSSDNSYMYYIDTGMDAKVVDIGHNYIRFDDGSVRLFADGAYLGNFEHTYYYDPVSPHFAQTSQDLSQVTLSDICFGEATASRDQYGNLSMEVIGSAANTIELVFTTPLLFNDRLTNTVIKYQSADSTLYVNCTVKVDRHRIVITPVEALQPGVTYTVTIPENAIYDVFKHVYNYGMITFTVTVTDTVKESAEGGSEIMADRYNSSLYPSTDYSPDHSQQELRAAANTFYTQALNNYIVEINTSVNNAFLNGYANPDKVSWMDDMVHL